MLAHEALKKLTMWLLYHERRISTLEIKVKIEADGLEKAIFALAEAFTVVNVTQKPAVEAVEAKTPVKEDKPVKEETKKQESKKQEAPKEDKKKEDKAPEISLETVRVKLAELNSAGKGAEVKALIAEFDSSDRPKLSNVAKEDYAELLEKAAAL